VVRCSSRLRFQELALAVQFVEAELQIAPDLLDRLQQGRARRDRNGCCVDFDRVEAPPVSRRSRGRSRWIASISSPNSEIRQARSS